MYGSYGDGFGAVGWQVSHLDGFWAGAFGGLAMGYPPGEPPEPRGRPSSTPVSRHQLNRICCCSVSLLHSIFLIIIEMMWCEYLYLKELLYIYFGVEFI